MKKIFDENEGIFKLTKEEGKLSSVPFIIASPIISNLLSLVALLPIMFITTIFMLMLNGKIDVKKYEFSINLILSTGVCILVYYLLLKFKEKRSFKSIGLKFSKKAIYEYARGFFIGLLMIGIIAFGICLFGKGQIYVNTDMAISSVMPFLIMIIAWMIQGASEEIMMRGYMLPALAVKKGPIFAITVSSVFFAALHLFNEGVHVMGIINLVLFAVFAAVYAIYEESIWGICALHSAWNFAQGNLFGFLVSGLEAGDSLFIVKISEANIINGGSFGPEGGILTSIICLVGIISTMYFMKNKSKNKELNLKI